MNRRRGRRADTGADGQFGKEAEQQFGVFGYGATGHFDRTADTLLDLTGRERVPW
jgi:hypothetical protein